MITNNIIGRTYFIQINEDTGSSFTVEYKDKQYLITAMHVLESLDFNNGSDIEINIFYNNEWYKANFKVYLHYDPEIDIAVLQNDSIKFPKYPVNLDMKDLYISGDTYFLGFPYGMYSEENSINNKFPIPFVKKGIISAINTENSVTTLYIDAHNNNGFSGGPVVTVSPNKDINIVGVNTSYLKFDKELSIEDSDEEGNLDERIAYYYENSGIMQAQSIHHVWQIIDQNNL